MKKTAEKVVQPGREKATSTTPIPGKPQQPPQEKKEEIRQFPEYGAHKKVRPEERQPGIPTEHQTHRSKDEDGLDAIEEKETTL